MRIAMTIDAKNETGPTWTGLSGGVTLLVTPLSPLPPFGVVQLPSSIRDRRHLAPLSNRQMIASIVRRSSLRERAPRRLTTAIAASNLALGRQ
jgi:hypothetical protein